MSVESYRESPGKFDSRTLSRKTLSRWTGRTAILWQKRQKGVLLFDTWLCQAVSRSMNNNDSCMIMLSCKPNTIMGLLRFDTGFWDMGLGHGIWDVGLRHGIWTWDFLMYLDMGCICNWICILLDSCFHLHLDMCSYLVYVDVSVFGYWALDMAVSCLLPDACTTSTFPKAAGKKKTRYPSG